MKTTDSLLKALADDFFTVANLSAATKSHIFSTISDNIQSHRDYLLDLVAKETKLTQEDANREIDRAQKTFQLAGAMANHTEEITINLGGKVICEKRVCRGPLLAITPFSSPLSSPAHKISMGLLAGTPVLFKPSPLAKKSGQALYKLISQACGGRYVYFSDENDEAILQSIVADERIGIISFTGSYATGSKIIRAGGVKKYQMELSGGNSPVIFTPEFMRYDSQLAQRLVDGITAKNGQRCVSVKHLFIPAEQADFIGKVQDKLQSLKDQTKSQLQLGQPPRLGPLITTEYAKKGATTVRTILRLAKNTETLIELEREENYIFPTMYAFSGIDPDFVRRVFDYDIAGPVVFVHFYKNKAEYEQILKVLKNDYVRSGLQLSFYVADKASTGKITEDLLWGGIIFNDLPTFRDEAMSFGGFGRAGLGKEGLFETLRVFTDPQTLVYPKDLP